MKDQHWEGGNVGDGLLIVERDQGVWYAKWHLPSGFGFECWHPADPLLAIHELLNGVLQRHLRSQA